MSKYKGIVKKGVGRGIKLGFPTANIEVPDEAEEGIFTAWVTIGNDNYSSLFFVGKAITFGEDLKQGEVHVLNFDKDIYGQMIKVEVLKKLRENKTFETTAELVKQMNQDLRAAREYFENLLEN